jgi:hypothetical protein
MLEDACLLGDASFAASLFEVRWTAMVEIHQPTAGIPTSTAAKYSNAIAVRRCSTSSTHTQRASSTLGEA